MALDEALNHMIKGIPTLSSEPSVLGIIWLYSHRDVILYLLEALFFPPPNLDYFIGNVGLNELTSEAPK